MIFNHQIPNQDFFSGQVKPRVFKQELAKINKSSLMSSPQAGIHNYYNVLKCAGNSAYKR